MAVVDDFIARYRREQDFYDSAAKLVKEALETRLQAEGIRAMTTYRAKAVNRLEPKVRERHKEKKYSSVDDIYEDIVDLAGARVALYFPGQRPRVGRLINELFLVLKSKDFPGDKPRKYENRFDGYAATHYRVQLKEASLSEAQKRFAEARIEIQVASVLMHAWSEVEHDLVYKPMQGDLSRDEYELLDQLNGLVMTGEIALEHLQRAGEARVASANRQFSNHYELASHILKESATGLLPEAADAALGRIDVLFEFLVQIKSASPERLKPYLESLHQNFEMRPISDQIIDKLLSEDEKRYPIYEEARSKFIASRQSLGQEALGDSAAARHAFVEFLEAWIALERFVHTHAPPRRRGQPYSVRGNIEQVALQLEVPLPNELSSVRRMRNSALHGFEMPPLPDLQYGTKTLRSFLANLEKSADQHR